MIRSVLLALCLVVGVADQAAAGTPRLGAGARFLQHRAAAGKLELGSKGWIPITVRFEKAPSAAQLAALRAAGAVLYPAPASSTKLPANGKRRGVLEAPGGAILGGRTVIPARVAPRALQAVAEVDGVLRVETSWSPQRVPPLSQTRTMSGVDEAWQAVDRNGNFLDGRGVLLADIDTGVDLSHPDYWHGDGGTFDWIDVDMSGDLSEGDAVDRNHNGQVDPGESLRWWEAPGNAPGLAPGFQTGIDHLYGDLNDNLVRDYGAPGFSDADPCFGEPLYRADDTDGDGILDPGETLTGLSTCKVKAIYETDDTIRTLGVDLIENEGDTYGHGTNVGSILLGGAKGREYAGFAPGADMIFTNLAYFPEHPFVTPLDVRMSWAAAEGADIFVYEDGEWVWEFLDGSSNVEILLNELASQGIIHVAAAGNLAAGNMHWESDLGAAVLDSTEALLDVLSPDLVDVGVVWGDFYWQATPDDKVWIFVETPTGERVELGGIGSTVVAGNFEIYTAEDVSPRGTSRVDFRIEAVVKGASGTKALDGGWRFVMLRDYVTGLPKRAGEIRMHAMSWDDLSSWFGRATWQNPSIEGTVTWPGTADSSITVAAYSPQNEVINFFSGRGTRVDGTSIVDLAAPGSTVYTGRRNQQDGGTPGGYGSFGGTSSATPHVAGSAALLKQWDPELDNGTMRLILREGALADAFTGSVPNDTWGAGKLNVFQSILWSPVDAPAGPPARAAVRMGPNVPNPFNPSTLIHYELPRRGEVVVEVLDLRGRLVRELAIGVQDEGPHSLRWDGRDASGRGVSSGIYLVRVRQGGEEAARKVTLLK